jgi:hypothetical protein
MILSEYYNEILTMIKSGKSDYDIATHFLVSRSAIQKFRAENGIKANHRITRTNNESICWHCGNAYVSKCDWIRQHEEIYSECIKSTCKNGRGKIVELTRVLKCDYFVKDSAETRLNLGDCETVSIPHGRLVVDIEL